MADERQMASFLAAIAAHKAAVIAGAATGLSSASEVVADEVRSRAKGSIAEAVEAGPAQTHRASISARVEVADSAPGGSEHHAIFVEFGTSKMAADPFFRPGIEASKPKVLQAIGGAISEAIK